MMNESSAMQNTHDSKIIFLTTALVLAACFCASAERARPHIGTVPNAMNKSYPTILSDRNTLLRGKTMKLGSAPNRQSWATGTAWADECIKDKTNAVRLALNIVGTDASLRDLDNGIYYYYHYYPKPENVLPDIDRVVDLAAKKGLYVMINYHNRYNGERGTFRPAEWKAYWDLIAPRYANRTHVLYEPVNEYMPASTVYLETIRAMRKAAPNTMIVHFSDPREPKAGRETQMKEWGFDPKLDVAGWHVYGKSDTRLQQLKDAGWATVMTEHTNEEWMWCEDRGVSWFAWTGQSGGSSPGIEAVNYKWPSDAAASTATVRPSRSLNESAASLRPQFMDVLGRTEFRAASSGLMLNNNSHAVYLAPTRTAARELRVLR